MSQNIKDFLKSLKSTGDLSALANQNCIAKVDTANDQSFVLAAGATDPIVGVLVNNPKAGSAGLIQWLGSAKVIAGGTITRGDRVTSDASGHAVTTTTDKHVVLGTALESAVAGDVFEVFLGAFVPQSQ